MTGGMLSGGVVIAVAAALWLAYLLPAWLRRREYISTERNAVRLQQTLRILAETAEVPQQVRVEATAREVAVQQRILRKEEERMLAEAAARADAEVALRRAEAAVAAVALETLTPERAAPQAVAVLGEARARSRRIRRGRAATSLVLLGSVVVIGFGGATLVVGGGGLLMLGAGVIVGGSALAILARLSRAGRVRIAVPRVAVAPVAQDLVDHAQDADVSPVAPSTWTPQPLPKPLYQRAGTIAASAMASVDAATELRRAAARADLERRVAELAPQRSPEVTPLRPVLVPSAADGAAQAPAATSRFARMGMLTEAGTLNEMESDGLDLDAVLRRRRAAG